MNGDAPVLYSSLLRRLQAALVDSFIVIILMVGLLSLLVSTFPDLPGTARIIIIFSPLLFLEPVMLSIWGGTIGYWLFNQVVTKNGTNEYLGPFRAFGRYLVKIFFGWLSLVFMFTTKRHQALHDLFADSVVTIRDISKVADSEGRPERPDETLLFAYPSPMQRVVVILLYLGVVVFLVGISVFLSLSTPCMEFDRCSGIDRAFERLYSLLFLAGFGFVIVLGWRGRLLGCRRSTAGHFFVAFKPASPVNECSRTTHSAPVPRPSPRC